MSPAHFLAILRVELRKLFVHPAGRVGIVLSMLIGVAGPAAMLWIGSSNAVLNGQPIAESMTRTAPQGLLWATAMRDGSHFMRLFVLMLGALSVAGELKARTLREALLRPVPRWVIPVVKFLALTAWTAVTSVCTWTVGAIVGAVFFGTEGNWGDAAAAMAVSTAGDVGMAALIVLLAILTRSVPASIVLAIVLSIVNWFSRAAMYIVEQIAKEIGQPSLADAIDLARPWTPTYALDGWPAYVFPYISMGGDWYKPLLSLAAIALGCILLSVWRLSRIDVH